MMESIFFNPWIWIIPIILLIMIVVIVLAIMYEVMGEGDGGGWITTGMVGFIFLCLAVPYFAVILPPYDASYYNTYRVTGEVASIEDAFEGGDGVVSKSFVVSIDGVDMFIRSDDQRFRTIIQGDEVKLACTKQFEYFVDPWLECKFN